MGDIQSFLLSVAWPQVGFSTVLRIVEVFASPNVPNLRPLHPLVRKRLQEVVQLLQVYARLAELEITSMQAGGEKLPTFNAREALDVGLPEGTKEKVQEWVEGEQERERRREEGRQVLKEVAALAESRGHDAGDVRRFTG